jgi:hypothetical protein
VDLLRAEASELFAEGRPPDYHDTVATTWARSFAAVARRNPRAHELLRLLAFLGPDGVPRDLLADGTGLLPAPLTGLGGAGMDRAIGALGRYSLAKRSGDLVSVHRLVQAVVRDDLGGDGQRAWAGAAVRLVVDKLRQDLQDLQDLAPRIGLIVEPSEEDLEHAYRCTNKLLTLIVEQLVPARLALARRSSLRSVQDLDRAVAAFEAAANQALILIHAFANTMQHERRQRERKRRSNRRFSQDQLHLHQLRLKANTELQAFMEQAGDFLRVIPL